jgi:hypothetical protein
MRLLLPQISLADYQRALSRIAKVTRETAGGLNRISFAPVTTSGNCSCR